MRTSIYILRVNKPFLNLIVCLNSQLKVLTNILFVAFALHSHSLLLVRPLTILTSQIGVNISNSILEFQILMLHFTLRNQLLLLKPAVLKKGPIISTEDGLTFRPDVYANEYQGNIKTTLPKIQNAKELLKLVEECSQTVDKSLVGTLMGTLTTMKFDGSRTMHEHVIEMTNIEARLKSLGMEVDADFLVQFKSNYYCPSMALFK